MKINYNQVNKGICVKCGVSAKQLKHHNLYQVFEQTGWFRGDDESLGKFCKPCRIKLENKIFKDDFESLKG
jgi:hypothetical protein